MHFWIDMSTPKEVLFFKQFYEELKKRGHKITVTSRKYKETNDLLKYFNIDAKIIGEYGTTKEEKMEQSIVRLHGLNDLFYKEKIDGAITLMNVETCRVAYGLSIPLFYFTDIIEYDIVIRLTMPLADAVFIPFHIQPQYVKKYWDKEKLYVYNCLDPVLWMPEKPCDIKDVGVNIDIKHPLIVYREAETQAVYFNLYTDFTESVIRELKIQIPHATFIKIPRYNTHKMIDLQSLLYYADVFIGGGGTITEEACWWGTWTISCRPFRTTYDSWLVKKGCLYQAKDVDDAVELCKKFLKEKNKNPKNSIIRNMVFPISDICDKIEIWCKDETLYKKPLIPLYNCGDLSL